ncbi:hypothetical protein ACKWTF_010590 [Chironomus riparius]
MICRMICRITDRHLNNITSKTIQKHSLFNFTKMFLYQIPTKNPLTKKIHILQQKSASILNAGFLQRQTTAINSLFSIFFISKNSTTPTHSGLFAHYCYLDLTKLNVLFAI